MFGKVYLYLGMYYLKYRPQTFGSLQRPNHVADSLMQQLKNGKTVHAYLFAGPRGVGKTTMARLLAKGLMCPNLSKEGEVCGECEFCLGVQNGTLIDLIEIDAASNRGIDDIRDLREKVKLMPARAKKKVYIIDEVHMLTNEAFNALLKTLEEPPKHAVFILCTTEIQKVPETIRSRCQVFKFSRPPKTQIVERLRYIAQAESVLEKVAEEELESLAIMAEGAFRDAETLLQQFVEGGHSIKSVKRSYSHADFLAYMSKGDFKKAIELVNEEFAQGNDLGVWTDSLLRYLRDILYLKIGFADDFFSCPPEELEVKKRLCSDFTRAWLVEALETFNQALNDLKNYSIQPLALEIAVFKLVKSQEEVNTAVESSSPNPKHGGDRHDKEAKEDSKTNHKDEKSVGDKGSSPEEQIANEISQNSLLDFSLVESRWKEVVAEVTKVNSSVGALVKSGKPARTEGNIIVLEVSYKFHKERLESTLNKKIVDGVLSNVLGGGVSFKCVVCQKEEKQKDKEVGELTDLNIRIPQGLVITGNTSVNEVFDGGLPI